MWDNLTSCPCYCLWKTFGLHMELQVSQQICWIMYPDLSIWVWINVFIPCLALTERMYHFRCCMYSVCQYVQQCDCCLWVGVQFHFHVYVVLFPGILPSREPSLRRNMHRWATIQPIWHNYLIMQSDYNAFLTVIISSAFHHLCTNPWPIIRPIRRYLVFLLHLTCTETIS